MLGRDTVRKMSNEAGQVMIVDLIGKSMLRRDEYVGKKAWLCGRDVCEPATTPIGLNQGLGSVDKNWYLPTHDDKLGCWLIGRLQDIG